MSDPDFSFLGDRSPPMRTGCRPEHPRRRSETRLAVAALAVCMAVVWAAFVLFVGRMDRVAEVFGVQGFGDAQKSPEECDRELAQKMIEEYEFMRIGKAPPRELAAKCREIADCFKRLRDQKSYADFKERERRLSGDFDVRGSFGTMGH